MWRTEGGVAKVLRRWNELGELEDWEERGKEEEEEEEDGEEEREEKAKAAGIAAAVVAAIDLRNAISLQLLFLYL